MAANLRACRVAARPVDEHEHEPEARIDQLTGLRTLVAPAREGRPRGFDRGRSAAKADAAVSCPFCEGREDRTPPELWANRPEGGEANGPGWLQRSVPNLYPALVPPGAVAEGAPASRPEGGMSSEADPLAASRMAENDLFKSGSAVGAHEVIVNAPEHARSLRALGADRLAGAMAAWRERVAVHAEKASYVHLGINEGPDAGATLEHSHAQLLALPFVPAEVARARERFTAYHERTMGGHLLADVMVEEIRRRDRLVAFDDETILICPWASRNPYELRLIPRTPEPRFDRDPRGAAMLAKALDAAAAVHGEDVPLNIWVRTAPRGTEEFHWYLDVVPRVATKASIEFGTGVDLNSVAPERAAEEYREALG